ncbi:MAG: hypothetical protein A4E66_00377 [Syntrophus sp. PtaB.Bin001]|nr:MAG: hypothetical protein A4E66_00377 [Syntrophus sp. PtaB.Bin001]
MKFLFVQMNNIVKHGVPRIPLIETYLKQLIFGFGTKSI